MPPFKRRVTKMGLFFLAGLLLACTGPPSPAPEKSSGVKEETLPAAEISPAPLLRPTGDRTEETPAAETDDRSSRIKFMYEDVFFGRGSIRLDSAARKLLDRKAEWLRNHPGVTVVIEGHTDYTGSREYNLALGDRRSGAVKSYLMRQGVARERLIAISYGREKPAMGGRAETARARNRRVHFVIEEQ